MFFVSLSNQKSDIRIVFHNFTVSHYLFYFAAASSIYLKSEESASSQF